MNTEGKLSNISVLLWGFGIFTGIFTALLFWECGRRFSKKALIFRISSSQWNEALRRPVKTESETVWQKLKKLPNNNWDSQTKMRITAKNWDWLTKTDKYFDHIVKNCVCGGKPDKNLDCQTKKLYCQTNADSDKQKNWPPKKNYKNKLWHAEKI